MNNLTILLKNNFNLLVGRMKKKNSKKPVQFATSFLIFGMIALIGLYAYETWMMYDGLGILENGKLCIFHACTTTVAVLIILGIMRSATTKKTNDSDLLLSMPIKKIDIVISKTVSRYLFDLYFVVMLFVPYWVIYQIRIGVNINSIIFGTILTFILPLFSVGVSYIFDFFVSRVFNKMRLGGMLKSILLVLIFVLVMGLLLVKTTTYGLLLTEDGHVDNAYFTERPISNLLMRTMFNTSLVNVLISAALTLIPFAIGLCFFAIDFGKPFVAYKSKNANLKFSKPQNPVKLLFKKELYNYANTTAFIINTIIGAILILVVGVLLLVGGKDAIANLIGTSEIPPELLTGILILIFCGSSSLTAIASSTVSLEGKSIYFLKTIPINTSQIIMSKVLLHIVVVEPFLIISSVMIWIALKLSFACFLALLIIPTLHVLIMAFGGLLLNLLLPNFDWEEETRVVKNSLAVLLSNVFGGLLTVGLILAFRFIPTNSFVELALICGGVYLFVLLVLMFVLFKRSKKIFEAL